MEFRPLFQLWIRVDLWTYRFGSHEIGSWAYWLEKKEETISKAH